MLRAGNIAVLEHFTDRPVPAFERAIRKLCPTVGFRCLWQNRQKCHFSEIEFGYVLVEIGARRRLHAKGISSQRDLIEVEFENLLLTQNRFDPICKDRFLHLSRVRCFVPDQEVFGDLLRDRRRANRTPRSCEVGEDGANDARIIDTTMFEKCLVFGCAKRINQLFGIFIECKLDAPFAGIAMHRRAVVGADIGRQGRLISQQLPRIGQIAGKGEPDDQPQEDNEARSGGHKLDPAFAPLLHKPAWVALHAKAQ